MFKKKVGLTSEEVYERFWVRPALVELSAESELTSEERRLLELSEIGFKAVAGVGELREVLRQKRNMRYDVETIRGWRHMDPDRVFLLERMITGLCEESGLRQGWVEAYTGSVPEENQREIEAFGVDDKYRLIRIERGSRVDRKPLEELDLTKAEWIQLMKGDRIYPRIKGESVAYELIRWPLMIVAPPSQMGSTGDSAVNIKIVFYMVKGGGFIVTHWE